MRHLIMVAAVLTLGCDLNIFGPEARYVNRRPMDPVPEVYRVWYRATERCLGQTGDFDAIRWFVAGDVTLDGDRRTGALRPPNEITMLAGWSEVEWAVRHEMVHHITGWGNEAHDRDDHLPCETG